jgi:hypothetical protein
LTVIRRSEHLVPDLKNSGDDPSYLSERIRATEKRIQELEAAGADENELSAIRGELEALRDLPSGARVFLQGSGEGSVIIGFDMPEDPESRARDPEGAA